MHNAFSNVLDLGHALSAGQEEEAGVDRILAAAFFRKRPLQAGTCAHVIQLADRRSKANRE